MILNHSKHKKPTCMLNIRQFFHYRWDNSFYMEYIYYCLQKILVYIISKLL